MAVSLELNSAAIAADLNLNAAVGAGLSMMNWNQAVASPVYGGQPGPVKETMDLNVASTTHDLLAAAIQALDEYRVQADAYMRDGCTRAPVWLECKMNTETGTRRALVLSISMSYRLPLYALHHGPPQNTTQIRLELWREPWWEDTATTAGTTATPAAGAQVAYDYTAGGGDVAGDVPARIHSLTLKPNQVGGQTLGQLWMGFRSLNKHGTIANFEPIWECEDGTNGIDAADVAEPGTASAGNKVTITPGTATWAKRMSITLLDVTGALVPIDENYGLFVWLLRSKVSAGTWEVQLRFGYTGMPDDDYVRGPIVEITNTSWDYTSQAVQSIPLINRQVMTTAIASYAYDNSFTVQIWARRTDGAGTLSLDCLCPVPADEGFLSANNFTCTYTSANDYDEVVFTESPSDQVAAEAHNIVVATTAWFTRIPTLSRQAFREPLGDGRLYIVYARPGSSVLTDTVEVMALRYDCWASLRGAE